MLSVTGIEVALPPTGRNTVVWIQYHIAIVRQHLAPLVIRDHPIHVWATIVLDHQWVRAFAFGNRNIGRDLQTVARCVPDKLDIIELLRLDQRITAAQLDDASFGDQIIL